MHLLLTFVTKLLDGFTLYLAAGYTKDSREYVLCGCIKLTSGGHGGRVATLSLPTSQVGVRFRERPQLGKLVVACRCSAVYSTEP